jgi:hypothetical protein
MEIITKKNLDRKGITFISQEQLIDYQNKKEITTELTENKLSNIPNKTSAGI